MSDAPLYSPVGDRVDFDLRGRAPLAGDAVDFDLARDAGGPQVGPDDPPAQRVITPGELRIPWGRLRRVDRCIRLPWRSHRPLQTQPTRIAWQDARPVSTPQTRIAWRPPRPTDPPQTRLPWGQLDPRDMPAVRLPWRGLLRHIARDVRLPWGEPRPHDRQLRIAWAGRLIHRDFHIRLPWGRLDPRDRVVRIPWWAWKPPKDHDFRIFWGRALYDRICRRAYEPPPGDRADFDLWEPLSQVGDGDHVDFWFEPLSYDLRCEQREPSGWRDNYFYKPGKYPRTPRLETLVVINTVYVTRIADNAPVEVFSVDLSMDIDSWCWAFSAKIPGSSLPLMMRPLDPIDLRIDINGHVWTVLAESWSESHSFARSEYTVRGRGRSAALAAPYAPERSGGNAAAATARQLAEEQLEYTGWTLDWRICDWLVASGALSYSNASPIKVIQQIAEAAGGRVISHRTDKQLIVLPRLVAPPWEWSGRTPTLGVNDYVVRQLSREYQAGAAYNAVYVAGETQGGVLCRVIRRGTDGAALAPMVTDALITDTEPAKARGELELGRSGNWSKESLDMPLTRSGVLPGLLEIGALVSMDEGQGTWRGQVVGVQVGATFGSDGLVISQHVDIERYRGS